MSEEKEKPLNTYIATVFGKTFVVDAKLRGNVKTHLVARLREEVEVRLATYADGVAMAKQGIASEVAGEDALDLLTGVPMVGSDDSGGAP